MITLNAARAQWFGSSNRHGVRTRARRGIAFLVIGMPALALAQTSPFLTGATALQTNILAWLTPLAIILVMVLGAMAMANRMSWGWCLGAIIGIAIAFGAPQIVTWVRGMFGV
jgi:type IV secretion system protein VirB2